MLRIVAVLSVSSKRAEIARDETGSPLSMYVRTISAKIWRLRLSLSAADLIGADDSNVLPIIVGTLSSSVNVRSAGVPEEPRGLVRTRWSTVTPRCRFGRAGAYRSNRCRGSSTPCRSRWRRWPLRGGRCRFSWCRRNAPALRRHQENRQRPPRSGHRRHRLLHGVEDPLHRLLR